MAVLLRRAALLAHTAARPVLFTAKQQAIGQLRAASRFSELVERVRPGVAEVTPQEVLNMQDEVIVIDVREPAELDTVADVKNLLLIPRGVLESKIDANMPDLDTPLVLYCAGGFRSVLAADSLQDMGYRKVSSMAGGFGRWRNESLPMRKGDK